MSKISRLIEVRPPVERALAAGAPRKGTPDAGAVDEHLDELARLAGRMRGAAPNGGA